MPFKSKAQMRKFFSMQEQGKLPPGTAEEWANATPDIKDLPQHVKHKRAEVFETAFRNKFIQTIRGK